MSFQPSEQSLQELISVLANSTNPNSEIQRDTSQKLEAFGLLPGYVAYLAHILIQCREVDPSARSVAGLILKNTIARLDFSSGQEIAGMDYVKAAAIQGMSDPVQMVRQTVGTVIVNIVAREESGAWPEGLEALMKAVDSSDPNEQEGAFDSLQKLAEDCPQKVDCTIGGQRPLNYLVERFIVHSAHPDPRIRVYALTCLKNYFDNTTEAIQIHIDEIIAALFRQASDTNAGVRTVVCQSLSILLNVRPDKILPQMSSVAEYMVYSAQEQDEGVALEASEFWLTFGEDPAMNDHLRPFLPQVGPLLLNGMVYSANDLDWLDDDEDENEDVPDRLEDIKPRHYGKTHNHEHVESGQAEAANQAKEEDEESDYDEDYEDEEEGMQGEWNLRKCSAAALDVMAVSFGNELLDILLPHLKEKLFSTDWLQKESSILALGAIAEGCMTGLLPHLPTLLPFLVAALSDPKPLVRSITCWTIGRYSNWIVEQVDIGNGRNEFFVPVIEGLLRMVLDHNKRVQEAGCSAFATLEEEAGDTLEPYLGPILQSLVTAFNKYQQRNLLILYDAIGTLADSVGSALSKQEHLQVLIPPLMEKWVALKDEDLALVPLLECLSSVVIGAGTSFAPWAPALFNRSLVIIQRQLHDFQAYQANPDQREEPDASFVVVALDLLSGLCQGLGLNIVELTSSTGNSILQLMSSCLNHPEASIRQSALALLGDIAIAAFPLVHPHINELMPIVWPQILTAPQDAQVSVCNNATWAVGEIALQFAHDASQFEPFVRPVMERLVPILCDPRSARSLSENAAVTIGRMGLICPAPIAPHLGIFAKSWCTALWEIKDNDEKDSAFRGFCMLIQANPEGIQEDFFWFCNAVIKWQSPSSELDDMFRKILGGFKQMMGDAKWQQMTSGWPPILLTRLAEKYGV